MVVIEVCKDDRNYAEDIMELTDETTGIVEVKSFSGSSELLQIGVTLSLAIIPALTKIIIELIKNKRHVNIKVNGNSVEGLTEKNAMKLLQGLIECGSKQSE